MTSNVPGWRRFILYYGKSNEIQILLRETHIHVYNAQAKYIYIMNGKMKRGSFWLENIQRELILKL